MDATIDDLILTLDRLERPTRAGPGVFKEWQHFNICDLDAKLFGFFNLGIAETLYAADSLTGLCDCACYMPQCGWVGQMESFDGAMVKVAGNAVGLAVGPHTASYADGAYHLCVGSPASPVHAVLDFHPRSVPLPIRNNVAFGDGTADWIIVPRLSAHGRIVLNGRVFQCRAGAYHDHNRGNWLWNEAIWWTWGFAHQDDRDDPLPISVVFTRMSPARAAHENAKRIAIVTAGPRVLKIFLDDELQWDFGPRLEPSRIVRLATPMNLLASEAPASASSSLRMTAAHGGDRLEMQFDVETALEMLIPREGRSGYTHVIESVAHCRVRGAVAGREISFATTTFFEHVT